MLHTSNTRSFWDILLGRSTAPRTANRNGPVVNCHNFVRQGKGDGHQNVFVEIHPTGGTKMYCAKMGITPPYMPDSYDDWCLEYLDESYVFSSLHEAQAYFTARHRMDLVRGLNAMNTGIKVAA